MLFLIYINDLHFSIRNSSVYHFADDTNLLNISNSLKRTQKQINLDLRSLYKWLLANKISLNCSKTELIIFHKARFKQNYDLKIKLNGHKLFPSDSIKYLGVHLDSTLSGKAHCTVLASKLRRANGLLSKIRHYVPKEELTSIYHALFSSHLTYGAQVWGQKRNCQTEIICKLQNRALRTINFTDFTDDPNPLYKQDKILKFHDLVKLKNILFIYDFLHNSLPVCFSESFIKLSNIYRSMNTRKANAGCLLVPKRNSSEYGLHSISHQSILTWNSFTVLLKCNLAELSRSSLKHKMEQHLLQQY